MLQSFSLPFTNTIFNCTVVSSIAMDTVWFEALHEYVQSEEWFETIGVFIDSHCSLFDPSKGGKEDKGSSDYDHRHFTVWKEFTDISEQILNDMLSNLGGTLDMLEKALDDESSLPPAGPRDDARKSMLANLLTFDSFPHFCAMMQSKNKKLEHYEATVETTYYDVGDLDKLTAMGFDKRSCVDALNACSGEFDGALQYLFDNPPPSPRSEPVAPPKDLRETRPKYSVHTKTQVEDSVEEMTKKAGDMRRRNSSAAESAGKDAPDDNAHTSEEKHLDYMLRRREELSAEIVEQRKVVVNYTKNPERVPDDTLEELYLFLKEMVHNGEDLAKHKKRIHTYVFSRITPSQGGIVPNLLTLMLLENEDFLLQKNVNRLLNGEPLSAILECGDESKADADSSAEAANANELDELHKQHASELQRAKDALDDEAARQRQKLQEQLRNRRKLKLKDCKDSGMASAEISDVERRLDDEGEQQLSDLNERLLRRNENALTGLQRKQVRVIEECTKLNRALSPEELERLDADLADELRTQHAIDLAKMREAMELEKTRQRAALQARLREKRKKLLQTSPLPTDEDAADVILNVDIEETNELNDLDSKFSREMFRIIQEPTETFASISAGARFKGVNCDNEDWMDQLGKLHKLHCSNLASMQSCLMDEKSKQHSNLQARLQAMRQKKLTAAIERGASPQELEEIEAGCQEFEEGSLRKLDEKFEEHLRGIEEKLMVKHQEEVANISEGDANSLESIIAGSAFDYESAAVALKAAHDRDLEKHDGVLSEEKARQESALKEKLARRREEKRRKMLQSGGASEKDVQLLLEKEERQAVGFLKDEWELGEYIDEGVERGVFRVLKTRGGTRTLLKEESEGGERKLKGSSEGIPYGGGNENEERGEAKVTEDDSASGSCAVAAGGYPGIEAASGYVGGLGDSGEARRIMKDHSDATMELIRRLKGDRRASQERLKRKLAGKREERMSSLRSSGASEEDVEKEERSLREEAMKEKIQNDRMLTLAEHKAIEEHEFSSSGLGSGGAAGEGTGPPLNTYELLDEIHEEFREEREKLQSAMMEEKRRQKEELKRRKRERRKGEKLPGASAAPSGGGGSNLPSSMSSASSLVPPHDNLSSSSSSDDSDLLLSLEVSRIHKLNLESRQTLDVMMRVEQARQKDALQKRLCRIRRERGGRKLPPIKI